MNYRVSAYITAYEDKNALSKCIAAINQQSYPIDEILVVDNSKHTLEIESNDGDSVIVRHYPENIGISGGLHIALQWSFDEGYDFLWTFDQDSEPERTSLEALIRSYDKLSKQDDRIGILAPVVTDHHTKQKLHGIVFNGYRFVDAPDCEKQVYFYQCDAVITSGSLVCTDSAKKIELPNPHLFIDAVDWEYCLKFRESNYSIYVIKDAALKHRFGNSERAKAIFRKRPINVSHYSALRYFYMCRNHTYVETRLAVQHRKLLRSILRRIFFLLNVLVKIVFYEKNQTTMKIWACFRGTLDGLMGRLNNKW